MQGLLISPAAGITSIKKQGKVDAFACIWLYLLREYWIPMQLSKVTLHELCRKNC